MTSDSQRAPDDGFWRNVRTPPFLLQLALILIAASMTWATVTQALELHVKDPNIHQTTACLDNTYVRRDVQSEQLAAIRERLVSIERKLDKLTEGK